MGLQLSPEPAVKERFEKAWETHRQLVDELERYKSYGSVYNEWQEAHITERTKILNAVADLLNQESEAGLVMFEEWLGKRKESLYMLQEIHRANEAVRYYREWMAGRGGKLYGSWPDLDIDYVNQIEEKFKAFIKNGYWDWPDD